MAKILGLDLGTNSIGWALIDDKLNKILGIGSRIFPMGVENLGDGDNEMSKNASRTGARGVRRQFFRRRLRKKILLQKLSENKMCPMDAKDFEDWKKTKLFPTEKLAKWFALNPYELRQKALNEKLSLEEIGRIFYHLIQRRGFLSNSRKGGNDDGAIFKGNAKEGKIGIDDTLESIEGKTLGSYLYEIYPKQNQPFQDGLERIRNRYTTRKMYVDEFELIWSKQAQFYSNLNEELKTLFGGRKLDGYKEDGVLFHQRPLRSQKHLVGNCSFEPTKTKCPISAIPFEMFRIYQWVNTVEYNGKKIAQEEKDKIIEQLLSSDKIEFKKLRKAIGKESAEFKFNYKDDDKIVGTYTISNLSNKKFFGKKWFDFSDKEQEDIWHVLYFFDSKSNLKEYAVKNWNFTEEQAVAISKFNVKDGYASLSRKAIGSILPFMQQGYMYDVAVVMGGIKNAFGDSWQNDTVENNQKQLDLIDNVEGIVRSKTSGGFIDIVKDLLRKEFGFNEKQLKKLYHHSATIDVAALLEKLPVGKEADKEIQAIRNPIVITALFELRKLVNELIDEYGQFDEIKVEMARDLKISKSQRNKIRRDQKRLERENDRVKKEVEKYTRVSHDNILKFKLWEECKQTCAYTGIPIPIAKLFTGEVQIEHIHPWSRSLNDSFNNKTLCYADENRRKGDKTPFEFYGNDESNWSSIKERALKLFSDTKEYPNAYQKFKRFVQQKFDDDFSSRQLNDTRFISKEAKNYLTQICNKVSVFPGQMTANLRQKWGLNTVLNDENAKTREDHRHHAIDALVMACGKASYLQELSKWNRYNRNYDLKDFPMPWETFRFDAEKAVDKILISHKRLNNIVTIRTHKVEKNGKTYINKGVAARGQLHKETVFGKRNFNGEEAFHVRKTIDSLTTEKQLEKVVDETIKELIHKRIQELGGFVKGSIPLNTFFIVDENGIKQPQIFLSNKNGSPVPVLKIRMKENIGGAEQLKDNLNQWVNPRNNHHVLIYKDEKGNLKEEVVTFWTVVERKRKGFPTYQLPADGSKIITTLHINDMFLLGLNEDEINWENPDFDLLKEHLYRVQKLSSKFYEFRQGSQASIQNNFLPFYRRITGYGEGIGGWLTHNPIKVKISVSGKISKYNFI
ncbi:CRISPR-associated endonuclease Csn1 [Flavobacterium sp. CF108]|uniref:type II CRISPR RNA-guided endonuclease Cas9 n=1 Tax=unclassified Flavobacterium TaxID=196869 RepID=UPI0008C08E66|nr:MULTISPECIES: type II CRISPR RNA-guided endonuclease Cas9 [unclassified Flavobacterium]SEN98155.1 CRISPR-associated endonuclease Csn1 [Flavobacterium sp. fv08]SHH32920.1 CRISPR-associated endonuclease Csn1 [Flavobacterium sp. CF108]